MSPYTDTTTTTTVPAEITPPTHVENPTEATAYEAKHTPHIDIELTDKGTTFVTMQVGYYESHPNELGHFFDWMELQAQGQSIARFSGMPAALSPRFTAEVNLAPETKLTAYAHCNLHGGWTATAVIPAQ